MMNALFLGTAGGRPSNHRNVTSIAVILNDSEFILVDCGEATQHQIMKSPLKLSKLKTILITHMHGDHIFGLPGLLCTLGTERIEPLTMYGPPGIKEFVEVSLKFARMKYTINIYELDSPPNHVTNIVSDRHNYVIQSCPVQHTTKCFAYKITKYRNELKINMNKLYPDIEHYRNELEKLGFSPAEQIINTLKSHITITMDDGFILDGKNYEIPETPVSLIIALDNCNSKKMVEYFGSCNAIIHECTYAAFTDMDNEEIKRVTSLAINHGHATNIMATRVAKTLNADKLILTHFSNRYDFEDEEQIIEGCQNSAENLEIICARDFMEICICSK